MQKRKGRPVSDEVLIEHQKKLGETDCGRVILSLLDQYGSKAEIARVANAAFSTVSKWFWEGKISRSGALALAQATGRMKEEFRPDLSSDDWRKGICGTALGHKIVDAPTADSMVIDRLAGKYGSITLAAAALGFTANDFNLWKSRRKIPAAHIRTLLDAL